MASSLPTPKGELGVQLDRMPQQEGVRTADDDWTGRSDAVERRRLQNRIHQRAFRKKKTDKRRLERAGALGSSSASEAYRIEDISSTATPTAYTTTTSTSTTTKTTTIPIHSTQPPNNSTTIYASLQNKPDTLKTPVKWADLSPAQANQVLHRFDNYMRQQALIASPRTDLLLTLIQYNVFRALVSNTHALGVGFEWLEGEATSSFYTDTWNSVDCPAVLRPTQLQRTVEHHPWIDLFPFPALRDNILRQGEEFDDDELCYNLVEVCHAPSERSGLIVWGEPSEPRNWEVSEGFLERFAWVLGGCWELRDSTNYWREKRGEELLWFSVTLPAEP
ncbi:hypothetical protein GLAREA_05726 [Glarea lozoyensis ATCC 20868]|uniref:BZIP domain-containing protein n=1 Tax=Glarea lozoyensis (strain ATCC 20868 / MF5171) TaxID=1116229 RepID=S3EDN0_GLAL2|nr:uncharacterized protein GLAREA_05726 [Glarea lozoyensis ATCC 20868]EPE36388.1 hypothetical protein GLAREA_05726 [Glarea lozoyensis ATCC 20868]